MPHAVKDIKACIGSILRCLEYLHKNNIVHRDLRWPNILKTDNGWMVIDFEMAASPGQYVINHHFSSNSKILNF